MVTTEIKQHRMIIGGEGVDSVSGHTTDLINPATNDVIGTVPRCNEADVDRAVAAARTAFTGDWARTSASKRNRLMMRLAELVRRNVDELAQLETLNSGKALTSSKGE